MKKADFLIIFIVLICSVLIYFSPTKQENYKILIYVNGKLKNEIDYNDSLNEKFTVSSEFGKNVVKIDKNGVKVTESTCADGLEIKQGYINKKGQSLICLPNRLVIKLKSGDEYEAISY